MKSAMSACALVELVRHARGTEWRFSEACGTMDEAPALAAETSATCTSETHAVDALAPALTAAPVCAAASSSKASAAAPACANAGPSDASKDLHFDERPTDGLCVGTLRWSGDGSFPPLAPVPAPLAAATKSEVLGLLGGGWRDYIEARIPPDAAGDIRVEAPLLDGLSYPLSLLRALATLNFRAPKPGPLNILVIGASSKAEARANAARKSNIFSPRCHAPVGLCGAVRIAGAAVAVLELLGRARRIPPRRAEINRRDRSPRYVAEIAISRFTLAHSVELRCIAGTEIALTFVGPEISAESAEAPRATRGRISAGAYRGTLGELLQNSPGRYGPADTIVAAFNTGMGSGLWPLMKSWIGDLVLLLQRG